MANPALVLQERATPFRTETPAGLIGMLAAPAIPRDTLQAALSELPRSAVAPLLERLAYHRVDGLAFRAVARLPRGAVDAWLWAALKRRHQRCAAATLVQGMAVAEVLDHLSSRGIRVAVLGGLRSVESIYGEAGDRPVEAHDLLVLPVDFATAAASLKRLGFEPAGGSRFSRGGLRIDLHMDMFDAVRRGRGARFPLTPEALMQRASSGKVAGAPARLLSPEDELLLMAIGAGRQPFGRLIRVADLAHLVASQGCALDWAVVRAHAAASHTTRIVDLAIRLTALLGVAPPWGAEPHGSIRLLERLLIRRTRSSGPSPPGSEILIALTAPGLIGRLRDLLDALRPGRRFAVRARRSPSTDARRRIVSIRPDTQPDRHLEGSVHGR